ncbi:MAG: gluconate 2-dehydrogenase subunit 3 family protein [Opitutus sp.]
MNPTSPLPDSDNGDLTRREAIKRAALVLGFALTPSLLRGALAAPVDATKAKAASQIHLSAAHRAIIAAAAERILPRTDTPGAIDVGVPDFIEVMYGGYMTKDEQERLVAGASRLEKLSTTAHQKGFAALSAEQQDAVLHTLASATEKLDLAYFTQLRELTVLGFFTSKTGGTTVLHFDPIPGRYDPCIPLSETGNVNWYMS